MTNATQSWKDKAIAESDGTQTGAILRCALDLNTDAYPRFEGKATVTSDGFLMCNFVDRNGRGHYGAFVGSVGDLHRNIASLANNLKLADQDHEALRAAIKNWIGKDWRS